jgi:hypothetical protein
MQIGTQLVAPQGLGVLRADVTYHFLRHDHSTGQVLLSWFSKGKHRWVVQLQRFPSDQFESGILSQPARIKIVEHQRSMPPWLDELEGVNFNEIDATRVSHKRSYQDQVEDRFQHIAPLLDRVPEILTDDAPLRSLAKHATTCTPAQHPDRIQLWFFTYLVFGLNIWALKRPTHTIGRWLRTSATHASIKYGRPSLHAGSAYGFPVHTMREQILSAYIKRCGLGRKMSNIHADACTKDFGCNVERSANGQHRFVHPKGGSFPSYYQFYQVVVKAYGLDQVQRTVYGPERVKRKLPDEGSFTEAFANLLEDLEVDVYRVGDRPKSMLNDDTMPALCVARGICVTAGEVVGVGFSLGSETSEAYRSMLFSMAIGKEKFCALFGLPMTDEQWPAIGTPLAYTSDRGPGAKQSLVAELEERFPIRELTPSNSGQSKASVESSQPKKTHHEGAPRFQQSALDLIEMVRRELIRACADNHTSDISARLTPQMVEDFTREGRVATPHNLWNYLDRRLRTNAVTIPFDDAVRRFCKPVEFEVARDGVYLGKRCYRSDALKQSKLLHKVRPGLRLTIHGYVLSMCVRTVWIECDGKLLELSAVLRLRDDEGQLSVTLDELNAQGKQLAVLQSKTRESIQAANAVYRDQFTEATGKTWDAGHSQAGRPKKPTGATAAEVAQIRQPAAKVRRA